MGRQAETEVRQAEDQERRGHQQRGAGGPFPGHFGGSVGLSTPGSGTSGLQTAGE